MVLQSGQNRLFVQAPGELTRSREQAAAAGDQCAGIYPDTSPGAWGILFKISGAVAESGYVGHQLQRVAGVSVNCFFTDA